MTSKTKAVEICAEFPLEGRALIGEYLPVSPAKVNLSNPEHIRQEMARVYREARGGKIETQDATRLIYMLAQIAKAYELGVIEQRLQTLEHAQGKTK